MLRIELRGPSPNADIGVYAEHRLLSWIGHTARDLPGVTVCFAREASGGTTRVRCRMVTRPLPWTDVAVEEIDADPYAAIDRCAERLASHLAVVRRADPTAWDAGGEWGPSASRVAGGRVGDAGAPVAEVADEVQGVPRRPRGDQ